MIQNYQLLTFVIYNQEDNKISFKNYNVIEIKN